MSAEGVEWAAVILDVRAIVPTWWALRPIDVLFLVVQSHRSRPAVLALPHSRREPDARRAQADVAEPRQRQLCQLLSRRY